MGVDFSALYLETLQYSVNIVIKPSLFHNYLKVTINCGY